MVLDRLDTMFVGVVTMVVVFDDFYRTFYRDSGLAEREELYSNILSQGSI